MPAAAQCVVMGDGKGFLSALVTGPVAAPEVETALARINADMPHYKQVRAFHLHPEPLTIESGLLTANGKVRRDAIAAHFAAEFERLYRETKAAKD